MNFQIKTTALRGFESYAQALDRYNSQRLRRAYREPTDKAIADAIKQKKHMGMHLSGTAQTSIAFRLHNTDVVTYHKSGSVTLNTDNYNTMSTSAFGSACAPQYVTLNAIVGRTDSYATTFDRGVGWSERWKSARCWRLDGNEITLHRSDDNGYWAPVDVHPWEKPVLDKKLAAAALKANHFQDFACWLRAYVQMGSCQATWHLSGSPEPIVDALDGGPKGWATLVGRDVEDTLFTVRFAVYQLYNCVSTEKVDWLTLDGVRSLARLRTTYDWV